MVRSAADIFEYCKKYVMHIGYHNADFDYTMAGANLAAVNHQQGLGVLMSDNLKWSRKVTGQRAKILIAFLAISYA